MVSELAEGPVFPSLGGRVRGEAISFPPNPPSRGRDFVARRAGMPSRSRKAASSSPKRGEDTPFELNYDVLSSTKYTNERRQNHDILRVS